MDKFCSVKDVYELLSKSNGAAIEPIYFSSTVDLMRKKVVNDDKYGLVEDDMDLSSFLVLTSLLKGWYRIRAIDIAEFINQKFKEKYMVTKTDILEIISKAMEVPSVDNTKEPSKSQSKNKEIPATETSSSKKDMYKVVQSALKNGITKAELMKKYKLTQKELTMYEGYDYWSDEQKSDHKKMLEYFRLHPDASGKEAIEKGCGKTAVGYRFALIPTSEQQEKYNKKFNDKPAPKAVIKGTDVKSLILSDEEKNEQDALYSRIKEIANVRNCSPRDITSLLKARLVKDYGIVIEQIKKELMIKFRVNRGEGKAPNALEAIVMSEYLPIAKSILDDMYEESFSVK